MQYSGKSKKNLKKFLYMNKVNSKEQEKSSSEVNNNLNASDSEERKNLFEYSNLKKNINENFKDYDEKCYSNIDCKNSKEYSNKRCKFSMYMVFLSVRRT